MQKIIEKNFRNIPKKINTHETHREFQSRRQQPGLGTSSII